MQWQQCAGRAEGSLCRISGLANTQNSHINNANSLKLKITGNSFQSRGMGKVK